MVHGLTSWNLRIDFLAESKERVLSETEVRVLKQRVPESVALQKSAWRKWEASFWSESPYGEASSLSIQRRWWILVESLSEMAFAHSFRSFAAHFSLVSSHADESDDLLVVDVSSDRIMFFPLLLLFMC